MDYCKQKLVIWHMRTEKDQTLAMYQRCIIGIFAIVLQTNIGYRTRHHPIYTYKDVTVKTVLSSSEK